MGTFYHTLTFNEAWVPTLGWNGGSISNSDGMPPPCAQSPVPSYTYLSPDRYTYRGGYTAYKSPHILLSSDIGITIGDKAYVSLVMSSFKDLFANLWGACQPFMNPNHYNQPDDRIGWLTLNGLPTTWQIDVSLNGGDPVPILNVKTIGNVRTNNWVNYIETSPIVIDLGAVGALSYVEFYVRSSFWSPSWILTTAPDPAYADASRYDKILYWNSMGYEGAGKAWYETGQFKIDNILLRFDSATVFPPPPPVVKPVKKLVSASFRGITVCACSSEHSNTDYQTLSIWYNRSAVKQGTQWTKYNLTNIDKDTPYGLVFLDTGMLYLSYVRDSNNVYRLNHAMGNKDTWSAEQALSYNPLILNGGIAHKQIWKVRTS